MKRKHIRKIDLTLEAEEEEVEDAGEAEVEEEVAESLIIMTTTPDTPERTEMTDLTGTTTIENHKEVEAVEEVEDEEEEEAEVAEVEAEATSRTTTIVVKTNLKRRSQTMGEARTGSLDLDNNNTVKCDFARSLLDSVSLSEWLRR